VIAVVVGFTLAGSPSTSAGDSARDVGSGTTLSLGHLKARAKTLDRPRGPEDVLPPKAASILSSLPGYAPGADDQSMRVVHAEGFGDLYVAPLSRGFAIVSSVGFGGAVPTGLSDANPAVGGTATLPDGRLLLLGIGSDAVARIAVTVRGTTFMAMRRGNGFWWVSSEAGVEPDDVSIAAHLRNGRSVRVS
jgi:hypothetical protein